MTNRLFPFSRFTVSGNSMSPALKEGQDVLIRNWFYKPYVGDIVVIKHDGLEKIKRIKKVYQNQVFVAGDNVKMSTNFGPIPASDIIGKVILIVR